MWMVQVLSFPISGRYYFSQIPWVRLSSPPGEGSAWALGSGQPRCSIPAYTTVPSGADTRGGLLGQHLPRVLASPLLSLVFLPSIMTLDSRQGQNCNLDGGLNSFSFLLMKICMWNRDCGCPSLPIQRHALDPHPDYEVLILLVWLLLSCWNLPDSFTVNNVKKSLKRIIKMKEVWKAIFWAIITEKSYSRKEECIKCSQINLELGLGFHFSVNCYMSLWGEKQDIDTKIDFVCIFLVRGS